MDLSALLDAYPDLTATEQRQVRDAIFSRLTELGIQYDRTHARGNQLTNELQALIAFVTANLAGFQADGTVADATAARNNLDQKVADYANAHPRVSGATRGA